MSRAYRSFAKLNLHLEVVGRRDDGYHELRTIFQTISLHDEIEIGETSAGVHLTIAGIETPAGPDNLVHRAASEYLSKWGGGGVDLRLSKRIPVGGGLGGGSSNAATVLLALRELRGEPDLVEELVPIAAGLGADVPYFLVGGTAVGIDRGDRILAAPDLPETELWIAAPAVHVSTRTVFESHRVTRGRGGGSIVERVLAGSCRSTLDAVGSNDLEATVLALFPLVDQVYTALVHSGAERVQISGSGGSMFAFFASPPDEGLLADSLPEGTGLFRTRTLTREALNESRIVDTPEGG
jgi:4-diphosphocytidyl-2-C-methyl-D-erythritol kinase